jgi:cell division inhibitor SulA
MEPAFELPGKSAGMTRAGGAALPLFKVAATKAASPAAAIAATSDARLIGYSGVAVAW